MHGMLGNRNGQPWLLSPPMSQPSPFMNQQICLKVLILNSKSKIANHMDSNVPDSEAF